MNEFIEKIIPEDDYINVFGEYFDYLYIKYTIKLIFNNADKTSKVLCSNIDEPIVNLVSKIKELMKNELEIHNELIIFLEYGDRFDGGPTLLLYLNKDI